MSIYTVYFLGMLFAIAAMSSPLSDVEKENFRRGQTKNSRYMVRDYDNASAARRSEANNGLVAKDDVSEVFLRNADEPPKLKLTIKPDGTIVIEPA